VLPAQQEPHEVLRSDRLDLPPPALPRVGMNTREQPARAELLGTARRAEPAADREALCLQHRQSAHDETFGQPARRRQRRGRHGAAALEVSAECVGRRGLLGWRLARTGTGVRGNGVGPRKQRSHRWQPFHRRPQRPVVSRHLDRAPPGHKLVEPRLPVVHRPHHHQVEQQVVQLVLIPRVRPDLLGDALDRGWVQPAELVRLDGQAAAQRHGAAAPFLQRCVVEVGEGTAVEYLVCEH
jgi:hypothetical protein